MERKTPHSIQPAKAGGRHRKASCKTTKAGVRSSYTKMTDNTDIQTVEDALVNIHETVLDPERAAPLIRKNLAQNLENSYIFRFYKKAGKIVCESKVLTSAQPKFLGKIEGLS
jgi:hypothetical protein